MKFSVKMPWWLAVVLNTLPFGLSLGLIIARVTGLFDVSLTVALLPICLYFGALIGSVVGFFLNIVFWAILEYFTT